MKTIRETLVHAAIVGAIAAAPAAQASVLPLQDAVITATYNGNGAAMLGLDHGFATEPGSNTTAIHPSGAGVEFFTADALFGFDFDENGALTIYNNAPIPTGSYSFRFDFGTSLAAPLTSFTLDGMTGVSGTPLLSLLDGGRALGLDLSALSWEDGYGAITANAASGSAGVPEPHTPALLLGGLGLLALVRRRTPR
jgi:hypothetical protein